MKAVGFLASIGLAMLPGCTQLSPARLAIPDKRWQLRETRPGTYQMSVSGPSSDLGSTVSLRADAAPDNSYGQAEFRVPIRLSAQQRISIGADVRPHGVRDRAVVWLRADKDGEAITTEYAQIPARGTSDWQRQETGFVVPAGASSIAYGVLLQGSGEVSIRRFETEVSLLPPADAALSRAARAELDSALKVARTNALWRDTISWSVLEERVRRAAAGAREPRDVYPALRLLTSSLGDHHSSFYTSQDMRTFHSGANIPATDVRAISHGVGYVNSPGVLAEQHDSARAYVQRTYAALRDAAPDARCGWVLDLRGNSGGTPEPMFAALAPFFGPDAAAGRIREALAQLGVASPKGLPSLAQTPVALLLGPQTGSAGERVTLAFRGRARSRSFGQPTAGVATARRMVFLPDGAALAITTTLMDTTRVRGQGSSIAPDVVVANRVGRGDEQLRAAREWVASTRCGQR